MIVKGQLIDIDSRETLPRGSVIITSASGEVIDNNKKATADDKGVFSIDVFPADYLSCSYIGYETKIISVKELSSALNIIGLKYNKSGESTSDLFKGDRGEQTDTGGLENKPIQWYYWVAGGLFAYYIYKKFK